MEYDHLEGMSEVIMFVHDCFVAEVNNDLGIQRRHCYMLYEVFDKSVVRVIRDKIHWSRGPK